MNQSFLSFHNEVIDTPAARATDPQTSHDAAAKVDVSKCRALVIEAARELRVFTDEELVVRLADSPISDSSVRRERKWMLDKGYLTVNGLSTTDSGGDCREFRVVWIPRYEVKE